MTLARVPRSVRWVLPCALALVIAALPLSWIPVATVGGFNLQLPYAAALLLGILLWLFPDPLALGLKHLPSAVAPWLVAYLLYLVVLHFGLAGGATKGMILRQVFFLTCGCIFALGIVATGADTRMFRTGGFLALVSFLAVSEVLAWQIGLSWITVIQHLVSSGDLDFVFYQFLKQMFQLVLPSGVEAQASDKNAVAVAILTGLILFRAGHPGDRSDRFGQIVTLLALAILVVLNTRSVLLLAAIALPFAGWIATMREGVRDVGALVLNTLLFFGLMAGGVLVISMDTAAVAMIGERFSFADDSSGNRLGQYAWALARIEENPLWGSGLGTFKGQPVHNLFLGAWMHAGIFAFVLVVFAYLSIVVGWFLFVVRAVTQKGYWVLAVRAEWIAVLPIVPLFRVWISGDSGHPSFVEWTALFAFYGLILTNRIAKADQRVLSVSDPQSRPFVLS